MPWPATILRFNNQFVCLAAAIGLLQNEEIDSGKKAGREL